MAARRLVALAAAGVLLLAGCSYAPEEPGLFPDRPRSSASATRTGPSSAAVDLPVAGEVVWTTAEGLGVTVRMAVHAVRRIPGATVLDWSVTPLTARGYRDGDRLPLIDLGLSRETGGDVSLFLLDPSGRHAYRPLAHRSRRLFNRCLCTPLWVAQHDLVLGRTRLLQVTFPQLPSELRFVEVDLLNSAPIVQVPVTPVGQAPTPVGRTDLARAAPGTAPLAPPQAILAGLPPQHQSIEINQISASASGLALTWTLRSQSQRTGTVVRGPPISDPASVGVDVVNAIPADGLRVTGGAGSRRSRLAVRWMTAQSNGRAAYECLCSELDLWAASLREVGGAVTVTTNFAAPPAGTRTVDVGVPGYGDFTGVPVTRALDTAQRLGAPAPVSVDFWTYSADRPPAGWAADRWPTPVPDPAQLLDYTTAIEDVGPLPGAAAQSGAR